MARKLALAGRSGDRTPDQRRRSRSNGVTGSMLKGVAKELALPIDSAGCGMSIGASQVRDKDSPIIQLSRCCWASRRRRCSAASPWG